jgi:hypothetical protein
MPKVADIQGLYAVVNGQLLVTKPYKAAAGDSVMLSIYVRNLLTEPMWIALLGTLNGVDVGFLGYAEFQLGDYFYYPPGGDDTFTMPNEDVTLEVYTLWWDWSKNEWIGPDDTDSITIQLSAIPEAAFKGLSATYS